MPEKDAQIQPRTALSAEILTAEFEKALQRMSERLRRVPTHLDDLAFMLQHEGRPLSLELFYNMRDLFMSVPPRRMLYKTARQIAKSTTASAANIVERIVRKETKSLIVTPLFAQAHRLSTEIAAPMVDRCLFRDGIVGGNEQQVLKRRYANSSVDHYCYAFLSAGRIRGFSGIDRIWLDEIQDVRAEFLPVIEQTAAGRQYTGWKWYTGTPLSMGNLIQILWESSSQAVEAVKCLACNRWNIGCVEEDLLKMIGRTTCVCAACGRPLDVMMKVYIPRYPEREEDFPGRHVSQVLHPFHALIPSKWKELRWFMEKYTTARFYNEILGESYDSADRMIDQPSLRRACVLGPNTFEEARRRKKELALSCVAVDWTGGGDGNSLTKIVFGGVPYRSSEVHIHYMVSLPPSMPVQDQIPEVLRLVNAYRPDLFAHDYTGHGWLFEALGVSLDLDKRIIRPFEYGMSAAREVIYANTSKTGLRSSLHLDHTRSLFALYSMLKAGRVKLPDWDAQRSADSEARPADDFMNMFAESRPGLRSGEVLYVRKDSGHSDDFVHATNFLASACWHEMGSYPAVADTHGEARLAMTDEEAAQTEGMWMNVPPDEDIYTV